MLDYHNDITFPNLMDVVNHFNEGRKSTKMVILKMLLIHLMNA